MMRLIMEITPEIFQKEKDRAKAFYTSQPDLRLR
jgi:hypothetical protein